jgi:hypothetical protein
MVLRTTANREIGVPGGTAGGGGVGRVDHRSQITDFRFEISDLREGDGDYESSELKVKS